jgi:hypothetical protein
MLNRGLRGFHDSGWVVRDANSVVQREVMLRGSRERTPGSLSAIAFNRAPRTDLSLAIGLAPHLVGRVPGNDPILRAARARLESCRVARPAKRATSARKEQRSTCLSTDAFAKPLRSNNAAASSVLSTAVGTAELFSDPASVRKPESQRASERCAASTALLDARDRARAALGGPSTWERSHPPDDRDTAASTRRGGFVRSRAG